VSKKKKPNKGFKRTQKEWEKSIAGHIGKAIDTGKIPDYLINAGLAYLGYETFQDWRGLLFGPIALKLATGGNLAAGVAGVTALALLGLGFGGEQRIDFVKAEVIKDEKGLVKEVKCPEGYEPLYYHGKGWKCVRFKEGFIP